MDFGAISSALGGPPIEWTDEPWDRRYRKERRGKKPLIRAVVAEDEAFRDRVRRAGWEVYDKIIVSFSGGKDSLAALLRVLELGAPPHKVELWHQNIDGEHDAPAVMDWPVTRDYIESVAEILGLPLLYQWRGGGGLSGEMKRRGRHMHPIYFESLLEAEPARAVQFAGRRGDRAIYRWDTKAGYLEGRMGMPAVSDNLQERWCSDVVKMEPFDKAILYDPRLSKKHLGHRPRILVVTGERRLEGKPTSLTVIEPDGRRRTVDHLGGRAVYHQLEPHGTNAPTRRIVDHWRPVLNYTDAQVWRSLERAGLRAHPAYELGPWGRCSCAGCIYSSSGQLSAWKKLLPRQFERLASIDDLLKSQGRMTWREEQTIRQFVGDAAEIDAEALAFWQPYLLGRKTITPEVVKTKRWKLPAGAKAGYGGGSTNVAARRCPLRPEHVLATWRLRGGRGRPDPRTVEGRLVLRAMRS